MQLRHYTYLLVTVLMGGTAAGQDKKENCEYHYFVHSRQPSTSICFDADRRWGHAVACNAQGKEIYRRQVRRVGGVASVTFSYYDNGAVKTAQYHDQPDGGIQWWDVTTYFATDGSITSEEDHSYDHMQTVLMPVTKPTKPASPPPRQEIVRCAVPYLSEYWYINDAGVPVVVIAQRKEVSNDMQAVIVKPGDTVKGGEILMAEMFVQPEDYYSFTVKPVRETRRHFALSKDKGTPQPNGKERRRYYYHIAPQRKRQH